jgi:hypothetical protein
MSALRQTLFLKWQFKDGACNGADRQQQRQSEGSSEPEPQATVSCVEFVVVGALFVSSQSAEQAEALCGVSMHMVRPNMMWHVPQSVIVSVQLATSNHFKAAGKIVLVSNLAG